ncbi:MAG: YceI family protein [Gammaproteobacteria bacterium]|nr:MAG: YceI family protein [Gammaproteobacteria bacterium]
MLLIKKPKRLALVISVLLVSVPAMAVEDDLCSPFQDGVVEESLVSRMLSAADDGYLYRIRKDSSRVGFCVDSQLREVSGTFTEFQGGLALGTPDGSDGQTMVAVNTASLETDNAVVDSVIKGKRFFDAGNFPQILFVSSGFEWTGERSAILTGDLTLRGETRRVHFDVELTNISEDLAGETDVVLFKATTSIRRSDFGMDTLSSVVSDTVKLCLSVEAIKHQG